jgi:PKD domain/Bacterial Ig-like domain (group 3)
MKGRFAVALAVAAGVLLLSASTAFGAQTTKTLSFPLSGSSTTNIFDLPFQCCNLDFDESGISVHSDIHGDLSLDMATSMSAPTHNDLTYTDTNLRQGRHLDLTNTFAKDSGSFDVNYTLGYSLSLYGFDFSGSKSAGDTLSCELPLLTDSCSHTKNIQLFSFTLIDLVVVWFNVNVLMPITTTADINGDGVTSHRTFTVAGANVLPETDLVFDSSPDVKDEGVDLSCSLPVNEPVNYAMGVESSHVTGQVTEGVGIGVNGSVFIPNPIPFADPIDVYDTPAITIPDLFSLPSKTFEPITLTAPGKNVDLGNLLPNNIAPTVAMGPIPTNGTEGSPIQLSVVGTGPGGSLSPCGDSSLDIQWSFDDGGSAFGKTVNHAFPDNFLGNPSPPRTGKVVITDPTGLETTLNFSVPVANVSPTVNAGPDKSTLWGVPVSFHANGADQGPVDNGSLLYTWSFGDPASPIGASGQDVSHVYSMPSAPGTPYIATVTVHDHDGATGANTVNVTVLKRATTTAYTGPIQSNSSKTITLTASLVDELNQAVNNGTIVFTLGAQSISAQTDASGVATATIKLNQKHGTYTVTASFAGNDKYTLSSNSQTFTIGS